MRTKLRRRVVIFGTVAAGVFAAIVLFLVVTARFLSPERLPNPNGYDDLVKAAAIAQIQVNISNPAIPADREDVRRVVSANAEALRLLRVGLSRQCMQPPDAVITNATATFGNVIKISSFSWVLLAEGTLAEMENRGQDAIRSYVDSMRVGAAISRGGVIMNHSAGLTCQITGSDRLIRLIPGLTCQQLRPLIAQLENIDANTVSWAEVVRNENRSLLAEVRQRHLNPFKVAYRHWQERGLRKAMETSHDAAVARTRLLIAEVALRSYRCEHGAAPAELQELIPKYLTRVPEDPFSRKALIYRPAGTNWTLYSLGPDRADDGGKSIGASQFGPLPIGDGRKGDLLYDSPW